MRQIKIINEKLKLSVDEERKVERIKRYGQLNLTQRTFTLMQEPGEARIRVLAL